MKYGELSLGQVEAIVNKLGGMEGVKRFLSGETEVAAKRYTFRVIVNYDLSVEKAAMTGNYDWENNDIKNKNFPSKRTGQKEVELRLFRFNKAMTSEDIVKEMDKQGYRPAELPELLALGAQYPNKQNEHLIIALGSVWRGWHGRRNVACLGRSGIGRELDLEFFDGEWHESCHFAAVCK